MAAESGDGTPAVEAAVVMMPGIVGEPGGAAVIAVPNVATTVVKTVSEPVCETGTGISHGWATVCWVALLTAPQLAAEPVAASSLEPAAVIVCVTALLLVVVSQQLLLLLLLLLMEWTG